MFRFLRINTDAVWENPILAKRFHRYLGVLTGKKISNYLIAKKTPVPTTNLKNKKSSWREIFSAWQQTVEERISTPLLYYQDATAFLTITDNLSGNSSKCILTEVEREVYLFCDSIQTKATILKQFPDLSSDHLEEIIKRWVANLWMFREENKFLSLAIRRDSMTSSPLTYYFEIADHHKLFNN